MPKAMKRKFGLAQSHVKQAKFCSPKMKSLEKDEESTIATIDGVFETLQEDQHTQKKSISFSIPQIFDSETKLTSPEIINNKKNELIPIISFFDCKYTPLRLLFRENEMQSITSFIEEEDYCKNSTQFLMVTGQPGSGKTLSVNHVLDEFEGSIRTVRINAMSCKSYTDFVNVLNQTLTPYVTDSPKIIQKLDPKNQMKFLLQKLAVDDMFTVLMIDEFESLFTGPNHDAFDLITISQSKKYKLKIIGLSNDIIWLQNQSKKLCVEMPQLKNILFEPYNHTQVQIILKQRMKEVELIGDRPCNITDDAMKFCAGQATSNKGGDLRNILDICKRIMSDKCQKDGDILITKEDIFGMTGNQFCQTSRQKLIESVSLDQQIILIASCIIMKNNDNCPEFDLQMLHSKISWVQNCLGLGQDHRKLKILSESIFEENLKTLSDYNLIEVKEQRINRGGFKICTKKIRPKISQDEINHAFSCMEVFKQVFSNL